MTCTLHVAWDDRLSGYDFGPGHPMAPVRLKLTMGLAQAFGLGRQDGVTIEVPAAATNAELELHHDPDYIGMVKLAGRLALHERGSPAARDLTTRALLMHGLGTEDNPLFPGMHEASAMVTGATLAAARAVWTSTAQYGASVAGGLHHAMAGSASGFCVYNDLAVATEQMTEGAFGVFASFDGGHDPADAVDRAITAARKAVFPLHGLMP